MVCRGSPPRALVTLALIVTALTGGVLPATILGIFPYPGGSHFAVFRPLMENLAAEGHEVVVVSHFPRKLPLKNYRDVSLEGLVPDHNNRVDFEFFEREPSNYYTNVRQLYYFLEFYEPVFRAPQVLRLTEEKFDLAIVETFNTDAFLGLVYKLGVPFIGISSSVGLPWGNSRFANPDLPSYIPAAFMASSDRMDFVGRAKNALNVWTSKLVYSWIFEPYAQRLAEKYLGPLPPLSEIAKNMSLLLVNSHFSLNKVRPLVPAYVEVGGIHMNPPQKLPESLEKLLNESKEGVIYFTMGSMLRGATLRKEKTEAFMNVFKGLNQTVLWKWEDENLPGKPANVHISNWFPQADILAHPNVVLYISHSGLLGIIEAVKYGIPTVNIPIYGDQELNAAAVITSGAGVRLDFGNITEISVRESIMTVLENPNFREKAKELSSYYNDRISSPKETALFWVEYVLRHKGAPRLQSAAVHMPWYQYLLLDVLGAVITVSIIILYLIHFVLKSVMKLICKTSYNKTKKD